MPASVNESVTASLLISLSTKCGPENNGEVPLEQRLSASSKRILNTDIDYEVSNDTYHSSVLRALKAKYSEHNDKNNLLTNGLAHASVKGSSEHSRPQPVVELYPMERVQMQWPQRCRIGSGFSNGGNTCYVNAVLQALFHIPPMFNWLMDGDLEHQRNCVHYASNSHDCIICGMALTLKISQQRTGCEVRPSLITSRLRSICRRLTLGHQEDAMEFLRYLFEAMEKCYLARFKDRFPKVDNATKETTPLNQIFGGYIRTDVTCLSCRGVSTTFQHFLDLTLDISRSNTLDQALDVYFSAERLEGDNSYRCERCRRKVPASKQFFLERLPNVLCIQLKRFSIEGKKISKNLQLPMHINLARYLSRQSPNSTSHQVSRPVTVYRLQAGVNHLGHTAQSGHYTTTAYTGEDVLCHFDDISVQKSGRQFCGSDVYLLMYLLKSSKPVDPGVRPGTSSTSIPSASTSSSSSPGVASSSHCRPFTKAIVAPTPFVPTPVRTKPAILNHNRHGSLSGVQLLARGSAVAPTKAVTELNHTRNPLGVINKPSKLVSPMPSTSKEPLVATVAPMKYNVQNSPKINLANAKETIAAKLKMPLVPYGEEQSSGDEADNQGRQSSSKGANVNGWNVTMLPNGHHKNGLVEKLDKLDGHVRRNAALKPDPGKRGDDSHARSWVNGEGSSQNDCKVRSTCSSWQVSTAISPVPPEESKSRLGETGWEVSSAPNSEPTSAEQSPGTNTVSQPSSPMQSSSRKKTGKRKREDSSTDSDSESREKSRNEREWVERTKETLSGKDDRNYSASRPSHSTVNELRKMSHSGYGGAHVTTWNGGKSLVDRQVQNDKYERRRQYQDDADYDPEMDGGRRKKMKTHSSHHRDEEHGSHNLFQKEEDYRHKNNGYHSQRNGGWVSKGYNDRYDNNKSGYRHNKDYRHFGSGSGDRSRTSGSSWQQHHSSRHHSHSHHSHQRQHYGNYHYNNEKKNGSYHHGRSNYRR